MPFKIFWMTFWPKESKPQWFSSWSWEPRRRRPVSSCTKLYSLIFFRHLVSLSETSLSEHLSWLCRPRKLMDCYRSWKQRWSAPWHSRTCMEMQWKHPNGSHTFDCPCFYDCAHCQRTYEHWMLSNLLYNACKVEACVKACLLNRVESHQIS